MTNIDKRLAELHKYVDKLTSDEIIEWETRKQFHAILCQLNMLAKDLEDYYLIEKCKCCCGED